MEIQAKNYTRVQLENKIKGITDKNSLQITGTREELARLGLSDECQIFGVSCVITDTPTENKNKFVPKPFRGEVQNSEINGIKIKFQK